MADPGFSSGRVRNVLFCQITSPPQGHENEKDLDPERTSFAPPLESVNVDECDYLLLQIPFLTFEVNGKTRNVMCEPTMNVPVCERSNTPHMYPMFGERHSSLMPSTS